MLTLDTREVERTSVRPLHSVGTVAMSPSRPYRFPALAGEVEEPARRSARQSCSTCGASAVASCVALCLCPCAVVSCFTLALVKAPYVVGRRWVRLAKKRRIRGLMRNTKRVRDLDDDQQEDHDEGLGGGTARVSKEWGELTGRAGAASGWWGNVANDAGVAGDDGRMRVSTTEKVWMEMYEVGNWGFGRLSFSTAAGGAATQVARGNPEKDGRVAARP